MNTIDADFRFYAADENTNEFYREVINGLSNAPRKIPPKYFYDEKGAALFESICEQPEYYPTSTEYSILRENSKAIAGRVGTGNILIEPGCGSCEKVTTLLDAMRPVAYVPVDISCEQLQLAAAHVAKKYDWLDVHAVCTDITDSLDLPGIPYDERRLVF